MMRKYNKPELTLEIFGSSDIVTLSVIDSLSADDWNGYSIKDGSWLSDGDLMS